jgi:hypothetical protein
MGGLGRLVGFGRLGVSLARQQIIVSGRLDLSRAGGVYVEEDNNEMTI